jgi:DNA-binding GntR family transcriptional regulator
VSTASGYLAVAEALRAQIAAGAIDADGRLPSEGNLAAEHRVARTTLRRALKLLEAEGLITPQQGRGWVVREQGKAPGPAFKGVLEDLRAQIMNGKLRAGDRLPSENDLASTYGSARGTIRRALVDLEAAALIETRPGVGRFVLPGGSERAVKSSGRGAT